MITVKDLKLLKQLISIRALAKASGINYNSLDTKIRNQKELTVTQSQQIMAALRSCGLEYKPTYQQTERLF